MHSKLIPFIAPLFVLTLGACAADSSPDDAPYYENKALGVEITDFHGWNESISYAADGSVHAHATAQVVIDGIGTHAVEATMTISSPEQGAHETVEVRDLDNGDQRWYRHEPGNLALAMGDADGGVYVFANGDGSFELMAAGEQDAERIAAADGYAAYRALDELVGFDDDARFNMILAYGIAHGPGVETRDGHESCLECSLEANDELGLSAPRASVCATFEEICDCLACTYVGQGEGCGQCQ